MKQVWNDKPNPAIPATTEAWVIYDPPSGGTKKIQVARVIAWEQTVADDGEGPYTYYAPVASLVGLPAAFAVLSDCRVVHGPVLVSDVCWAVSRMLGRKSGSEVPSDHPDVVRIMRRIRGEE